MSKTALFIKHRALPGELDEVPVSWIRIARRAILLDVEVRFEGRKSVILIAKCRTKLGVKKITWMTISSKCRASSL
jgi:hypothetical protein